MSHKDLLRGRPLRGFARATTGAHVGGDLPVLSDDLLGLFGGDGFAGGVADDVGHVPVHDGSGTFGQPGRDHAQRLEMVRPAFDHLRVVDLRQLRVLFAGVVSGADQS